MRCGILGFRVCTRALRCLQTGLRGGVLVQGPRLLPVVRDAADGGHGGVVGGPGDSRGAGAAVGAVAAVSGAACVRV